jgi:hypothetical protein
MVRHTRDQVGYDLDEIQKHVYLGGLVIEGGSSKLSGRILNRPRGVRARQNDRKHWAASRQLGEHFESRAVRHAQIANERVEQVVFLPKYFQNIASAPDADHIVPVTLEETAIERADPEVVIRDEQPYPEPPHARILPPLRTLRNQWLADIRGGSGTPANAWSMTAASRKPHLGFRPNFGVAAALSRDSFV